MKNYAMLCVLLMIVLGGLSITNDLNIQAQDILTGNNWSGEYFNDISFSPPAAYTQINDKIAFNFYAGSPSNGITTLPADNFSVRWTTTQFLPSGAYLFTSSVEDDLEIMVDDTVVIGFNNTDINIPEIRSGTVTLIAGFHSIKVSYKALTGKASINFFYQLITDGTEMLANRSFELPKINFNSPKYWNIQRTSGDKRACPLTGKALSGLCAFKFTGSDTDQSKLIQNVNIIGYSFKVGHTLTASAFFKSKHPSARINFELHVFYTSVAIPDKIKSVINQNLVYTRHVLPVYTLISGDIRAIKVIFNHKSKVGIMWIDDVSLIHAISSINPELTPEATRSILR